MRRSKAGLGHPWGTSMWLGVFLAVAWLAGPAWATVAPITSVVAGTNGAPPYMLQSITVGGYTVAVLDLRTGTTVGVVDQGGAVANMDSFDLNSIAARDNPTLNTLTTTMFGGQTTWQDTNGNQPDFFLFEAGMNDIGVQVQAILPGGGLGQAITLPNGSTWGDTGLDRSGSPNGGQSIGGVCWAITDLKDAGGASLTNGSVIQGLVITSLTLDPTCLCAVVTAAHLAELVAPASGAPVAGPSVNLQWEKGDFTGTVTKYYVYLDTESADVTDPNRDKLPPGGPAILVRKQQVNPAGGTESWTWTGPVNDDTNYYWLVDTVALVPKSPTDPNTMEATFPGGVWNFRGSRTTAVLTGPGADQYVLPSLDKHKYAGDPNVTFTVAIGTDPEYPTVYDVVWYRDGAVVSNDSRHTITTSNTQTSLKIEPVDLTANALADNGRYYCQVRLNIGGSPGGMVESSKAWLVATQILRHRYSFTKDVGNTFKVTDSVWGKHGTITEPNHWGRWSWGAGELALNFNQPSRNSSEPNEINWVDLPNNMISALGNHATFLVWYTRDPNAAAATDAQAFCYGTPGSSGTENATGPDGAAGNNVSLSPRQGAGAGNIQFSTRSTTGATNVTGGAPAAGGTQECAAVVWNGTANQITVYKNGVAGNTGAPNQKLSDLKDLNNWLGRGQRNLAQTFVGKYNELRIYDIPLTAPWVKALSDAGPEVLTVDPCLLPESSDYTGDCLVNLQDFASWAADWLYCGLLSCN